MAQNNYILSDSAPMMGCGQATSGSSGGVFNGFITLKDAVSNVLVTECLAEGNFGGFDVAEGALTVVSSNALPAYDASGEEQLNGFGNSDFIK